ncbi:hypothetical protein VTI74DRAFT_1909 [Chaetomium olivicolor]
MWSLGLPLRTCNRQRSSETILHPVSLALARPTSSKLETEPTNAKARRSVASAPHYPKRSSPQPLLNLGRDGGSDWVLCPIGTADWPPHSQPASCLCPKSRPSKLLFCWCHMLALQQSCLAPVTERHDYRVAFSLALTTTARNKGRSLFLFCQFVHCASTSPDL